MNAVNLPIVDKCLPYSLCFIGGYALNKASLAANRLAVKYLGLPIDILNHQEYSTYSNNLVESNRKFAKLHGIGLDRQLGALLSDFTAIAIREEISYRFLLETIVLSCIFPQFAAFSIARTCVSSLLFAARHLHNKHSNEELAGQFINVALLGVICSVAQQTIGLLGSIFIHIGYNLHAWQYMYNQDLPDVAKKLKAIHLVDVIHPIKIGILLAHFIDDAISPFVLTYQAAKKILCSKDPSKVNAQLPSTNKFSSKQISHATAIKA